MQLWVVRIPAPETHSAFRGWPVSILELSFYEVSLWSRIPQKSTCVSSASTGSLTTSIVYRNRNVALTSRVSVGRWLQWEQHVSEDSSEAIFFRRGWSRAHGKHPPGAIPDGDYCTNLKKTASKLVRSLYKLLRSVIGSCVFLIIQANKIVVIIV